MRIKTDKLRAALEHFLLRLPRIMRRRGIGAFLRGEAAQGVGDGLP